VKTLILWGLFALMMLGVGIAHAEEYEEVKPCNTDSDQVSRFGLMLVKGSVRETAARCNVESVAEVVTANHHTIVVDPSVPDEFCGMVDHPPGGTSACAWFIKKVLIANGLAPIQEQRHLVRIVPLKSVKPGQPLADMSW